MSAGNSNSKSGSDNASLYVHVPFCRTKCRYCAFYSVPARFAKDGEARRVAEYDAAAVVSAMLAELERHEFGNSIKNIYIGGGSPSCLPPELLLQLVNQLALRCPTTGEFTIEVNPGQVDETMLNELQKAGVNRLSIGAQSFIQQELDFLGRTHTVDSIRKSVRQGKAAGFDNISLDLIFAVPGSNLNTWKHSLQSAIDLDVRHISAYALTYEKGTPLQEAVSKGQVLPTDEETDRLMYETAIDELERAGFQQYEISNFAKGGLQCRHNLNCWANGSYIGIGPAAASYLNGTRSINYPDIGKYVEAIENGRSAAAETETLTALERACETAVLNLRRRSGIDLAEFKTRTGFDATQLFASPIQLYQKQGLINAENGHLFLTRNALAIADSILCDFAAV